MTGMRYLDFDLSIERAAEGYRAQVVNSPAGQAMCAFTMPFSELELENFVLRLGHTRHGVRGGDGPEDEAARAFGKKLFTAVFDTELAGCLRSSLDEAAQQGAGLRLRLRLSGAPELLDLPWEYLYHPSLNRFFVLSAATPVVRFLDLPQPIQPLVVTPPLRLLVVVSSPTDFEQLDVEQEWSRLRTALADLEQRGLVTLERLDEATLGALQRRLRQQTFHILHFIGHGGFDVRGQDGFLLLEDAAGRGRETKGHELGVMLHDHRSLRLVVLNACEGARVSRTDLFGGTAQSLVQQGIPAVIAMQFPITDEAAIVFAREFYGSLADGYPVDAALGEARKAIFAEGSGAEWGTPVLYLRAPDGQIFNVERPPIAAPVGQRSAPALPPAAVPAATPDRRKAPRALIPVALLAAVLLVLGLGLRWLFDGQRITATSSSEIEAADPVAQVSAAATPITSPPAVTVGEAPKQSPVAAGAVAEGALTLVIGDTVENGVPAPGAGYIEEPGATDVYAFSAAPGQTVFFQVKETSNDYIRWRLRDETGETIFDNCLGCTNGAHTLARGGTYSLIVGGEQETTSATYSFRLWDVPPPERFPVKIGDTVETGVPDAGAGYVETPGVKDVYTFEAAPGERVFFEVLESGDDYIRWVLTDELDTVIFDSCLGCTNGAHTLARGGEYTITVGSDTEATVGTYRFRLWAVPPPERFTIAVGDTVEQDAPGAGAGFIETPGVKDVYTFEAAAGATVFFEVLESGDDYIRWVLTDELDTVIFDSCLGCTNGAHTLARGGEYTITVGSDTDAIVGTYRFRISAR